MGLGIEASVDCRKYSKILSDLSVLIIFISIFLLAIDDTRCDQVSGVNVYEKQLIPSKDSVSNTTASSLNSGKSNPAGMLHEIYLDHNRKVITMLLPHGIESAVQKFHPNGRYGRRSIDSSAEPTSARSELATIRLNDNADSLRSILLSLGQQSTSKARYEAKNKNRYFDPQSVKDLNDLGMLNLETEASKLLQCNYLGVTNLYWCDSGS